ncbi:MAG: RICIN domain-containing protein, partial [Lachnospiraceae bacterium]|nr:RICIN domain-containing protein [Lachnospiraceae bacterium]
LLTDQGLSSQKFYFRKQSGGYYTITNMNSGKALDVQGGATANSANIQQYTSNGGLAQKWIIRKNKDKTYTFINAWTGKAMQTNDKTEAGKKLSNKTNICQGKDDQGSNQKFLIR